MPRTQRNIRRKGRKGVAARTSSNDLYRVSGSLGYSNNSSSSSSDRGNDDSVEKGTGAPLRRASLAPPTTDFRVEEDVSEESSDGWSDDDNEMSGDVFFAPPDDENDDDEDGEDENSNSGSMYSESSSSRSALSKSDQSYGSQDDDEEDDATSSQEGEEDDQGSGADYGYGDTFDSKFEISEFAETSSPHELDQPDVLGSGFGGDEDDRDDNMFHMADQIDSPEASSSSENLFPQTEMDDKGDFDSGFPEQADGFVDSSDEEEDDHGFGSIPLVITPLPEDQNPDTDYGLDADELADPTRNYDSRYDGALSDVVDDEEGSDSDDENDTDNDPYDAGNAMYGSNSGLGYITGDNSSRSQPDPLLKPYIGERPPTPPSPCESTSERSCKSNRSAKSAKSTRSLRSTRTSQLSRLDDSEDRFDCQTYLAPPSINFGPSEEFLPETSNESPNLTVPYASEDSNEFVDLNDLHEKTYDHQFDPYNEHDAQCYQNEPHQGESSQFLPDEHEADPYIVQDDHAPSIEREHYEGHEHHSDAFYQRQTESSLGLDNQQTPHTLPENSKTLSGGSTGSVTDLEKARRRDQKIIRLLAIGLCCALFSFALVLGGAVTAAILRRANTVEQIIAVSTPVPAPSIANSPTAEKESQRIPTLRPSLRPTSSPISEIADPITKTPTTSPTIRPTPAPTLTPTMAPQSVAPTPDQGTDSPTKQPVPNSNMETGNGFGSGFGNGNSGFGSVTLPSDLI